MFFFILCFQLIRKRTAAIERVKKYLSETIEDHKATFDPNNIRDFIDLYIKATKDDTAPEIFTGTCIKHTNNIIDPCVTNGLAHHWSSLSGG